MPAPRSLLPAVLVALVVGGCGGSGSGGAAAAGGGGERAGAPGAVRARLDGPGATTRAFARAVLSARTARMCRLLRGQARRVQGCGGMGEDFGPMLRLTVRSPGDVRLVSASGRDARAAFPRLGRDARRRPRTSWCRPQQMRLQRRGDRWFVVELVYGGDFEPIRAGCYGLPSAARDPRQALPVRNAGEGACPRPAPDPLEPAATERAQGAVVPDAVERARGALSPAAIERARGAALRQASVLYPGVDLTGMRATRAVHAPEDDAGRGGFARVKCGAVVQERTVVVELEFPALLPSASMSQGVVLVSRFGTAYRVWAVLH